MTKEGKAVNYTAENVERMSDVYGAAETEAERKEAVTSLAKELGKTINSIVAKLSSEGVYIKAAKTKAGAKAETKADIVADIAKNLGVSEATFESLSNATKAALVALREGVADA
ncbi:MAG: hypothetical protein GY810_32410 [Aureispira sp.]|nr:hypothetical protein [Aureispira sp.]